MLRWSRRLLLLGWLAVGLGLTAAACGSPTEPPRLPEAEEEEPPDPPDDA